MIIWVIYDIQEDKARSKVAKACLQSGLYRVQYSAFIGRLDRHQKDSLKLKMQDLIDTDKDKVYMFPMSKDELGQTVLLGQAFDKKFVTDEVKSLFF